MYEVAEELGLEPSQLMRMLREMDILVRSHMSTVDPTHVARLRTVIEREKRGVTATAGKSAPTLRRRRRIRRTETVPVEEAETAVELDSEAVEETPQELAVTEADLVEPVVEEVSVAEVTETVDSPEEILVDEEVEVVDPPDETPSDEVVKPELSLEISPSEEEVSTDESVELKPDEGDSAGEVVEPEMAIAPTDDSKAPPKPVRRDMPSTTPPREPATPKASAAPGGTVRISAEGYTVDGRKKQRKSDRKKRSRVDRDTVQENVKKTLAAMGSGSPRKRRRDTQVQQQEEEQEQRELEEEVEKVTIRVNEFLTVAELADLMTVPAKAVITSAFKNLNLMVTINQRLDFDQIDLICEEAGFQAVREEAFEAHLAVADDEEENQEDLVGRPPIVTVMGHVDHGKTSLLDKIRHTNVIAGEAGGITQHIGAYQVDLANSRTITFLDTPGHEAFTAMRARGADVTDIVILVVAADDSVMPQTIEAISHAKNASVPVIVAVNKIDLASANVNKVKQALLEHDVILEEFGGEVLSAEVSAVTGDGVDDLLEKVLLQAELLELKANPDRDAKGTVVEAQLDKGMGPVATVLIERGTVKVGDNFVCGLHGGRVRALLDERGQNIEEAGPAMPTRILGLEGVPQAGDSLVVLTPERVRDIVTRRQQLEREKDIRRRATGTRLEDVFEQVKAGKQAHLNVVIKADTDGSVQALSDSLERLSTDEVAIDVIHRGVGGINESDVLLASTSQAIILGFHVRPDVGAAKTAERESVEVRIYNVIYEAVEEIRLALEGLLVPEEHESTVGSAEVREIFRVPKAGTVAGCYVQAGTMRRNLSIRLLRDQVQIYEGRMESLRRFKDDAREVKDGYECGISIENYNDVKIGDMIECYEIIEVARTLSVEPGS